MTTAPTPLTDRHGFPLVTCSRCRGTGTFSFNNVTGDTCFGCLGTGTQWRRGKVRKAAVAYHEECARNRFAPHDLEPGMFVRMFGEKRNGYAAPFRELAEVIRERPFVWQTVDGVEVPTAWLTTLVFVDGMRCERQSSMYRVRRVVDVTPYLRDAGVIS